MKAFLAEILSGSIFFGASVCIPLNNHITFPSKCCFRLHISEWCLPGKVNLLLNISQGCDRLVEPL